MLRRLKDLAWFLGFCIIVLPVLSKLGAQLPNLEYIPAIRFGVVTPEARNYLAMEWDRHAMDDPYLERGYCGRIELGTWAGQLAYIVTNVYAPDVVIGEPTTTSIDFRCFAWNSIPIHVHPPRNCPEPKQPCTPDGMYAYQCLPSDSDRHSLAFYGFAFGIVQCERKGLRTFWPTGVAGQ